MNMIILLIIATEIAFWFFIVLGLMMRYIFKKQQLSLLFFILAPCMDVLLLIMTALDIKEGGTVGLSHVLAAIYIGFSIGYGKSMIDKADAMFKEYVLKEKVEPFKPKRFEGTSRHIVTYIVSTAIMLAMIFYIDYPAKTSLLNDVIIIWTVILLMNIVISLIMDKKRSSHQ